MKRINYNQNFLIVLVIGILSKLFFINMPLVDAGANMRQTFTAGFTRYLIENGITFENFFHPKSVVVIHDALEVPLFNLLTVGLARFLGDHDYVYRLTSLIFWVIGLAYFAYLLKRTYGEKQASWILWVYLFLPLSIYIGRYYHPEVLSILISLAVVFHFHFFLEKGKALDLIISVIALTLALVVRASHFHLYIVLMIMAFSKYGLKLFVKPWAYLYIIPLFPYLYWTMAATDLTQGYRMHMWIGLFHERFTPMFLGMMFFNRLGGLTLSAAGLVLAISSLASAKKRTDKSLEFAWFYGSIAFIMIVARSNYIHPHYQAALLVPFSILIGRFLYQVANDDMSGTWIRWWKAIPAPVFAVLLSLYLFINGFVTYLFYILSWDRYQLVEKIMGINKAGIVAAFVISQAIIIPLVLYIIKKEKNRTEPSPKKALAFLIAILVSGLIVLPPIYQPDMDYVNAGKTVRKVVGEDKGIAFTGKKTDADPFIFYSGMHGWAYNPEDFKKFGWGKLVRYRNEGADYLAVLNSNRFIREDHSLSSVVNSHLEQLDIIYQDSLVTIYDLDGIKSDKTDST